MEPARPSSSVSTFPPGGISSFDDRSCSNRKDMPSACFAAQSVTAVDAPWKGVSSSASANTMSEKKNAFGNSSSSYPFSRVGLAEAPPANTQGFFCTQRAGFPPGEKAFLPSSSSCLIHGDSFSTAAGEDEGDPEASLLLKCRTSKASGSRGGSAARNPDLCQFEDADSEFCASQTPCEAKKRHFSADAKNANTYALLKSHEPRLVSSLPPQSERDQEKRRESSQMLGRRCILAFEKVQTQSQRESVAGRLPSELTERTAASCLDAASVGNFFDGGLATGNGESVEQLEVFGVAAKIKDGLFLGDSYVAQDPEFFVANIITHVINCSDQTPNFFHSGGISYLNLPCPEQGPMERLLDSDGFLSKAIFDFIEKSLALCEGCLVHSARGQSRGATVLIAYFMQKYLWSLSKAKEFLVSRRPDLEMNAEHWMQLQQLECRLWNSRGPLSRSWSNVSHRSDEEMLVSNTYLNSLGAAEVSAVSSTSLPSIGSSRSAESFRASANKRTLKWRDGEDDASSTSCRSAGRKSKTGARLSILKNQVTTMFASAANAADGLRTCPVAQNPQAQGSLKKPGSRDELEIAENTKKEFGLHSKAASASRPTESHKSHGVINRKSDSPSAFLTPEYGDLSRQHPAAPLCPTPFSPLLAEALQAAKGSQKRSGKDFSSYISAVLAHKPIPKRYDSGFAAGDNLMTARLSGGVLAPTLASAARAKASLGTRSEENKHFFQMYTTEKSRSRSARASAPSQSSPGPGTSSADSRVLNPYERTGFSTHQPAPAYLRVPGRVHRLVPRHLSRAPSPTPNFNRGTLGKPRWRL
ncbi:dual specificity phosphatase, catalytic domain-containing protein [Toxoplasma gondii ME49]|uniref:Dual specificity phosphatase, catalytic domain-containing protein n=1 Tax=Toxoplasma gondii (strain ATCC 50611 / Me49) TaxID=508771 RepID=S8G387_TOXGM|nr:dual specificity phosphatase, catalytic domain-containing protein [Toxoplasma gondii ME49]EPT26100.1 dual specificity phosphatase, catalytic domain-containing protein [Toxoplasma gondii ME49]|eukprot:XP_018635525.1 dual specificity phosphatase, catalytic domain-containing protein [Toxoplasma gondii ME49]